MQHSWCVVLNTLDRSPGPNYLGATLEGLRRSIAHLEIQVVDGGSPDVVAYARAARLWSNGVTLHPAPAGHTPLTRNDAGMRCLEIAVRCGSEWVLFLEDDLAVCDDLLGSVDRWVADRPVAPGPTVYSFYCPFGRAFQEGIAGAWDYPVSWFNGCQAFALRSDLISGALADMRARLPMWGSPGGFDRLISAWLMASGGQLIASVPSFVQHVGYQTAMGYPHWHQSPTFPGVDWSYRGLTEGRRQT